MTAAGEGDRQQELVAQFPIRRAGYAVPPPLPVDGFRYIGVQARSRSLPLSTGERWLQLVGQVVNGSDRPITLARWRLTVKAEGGATVLDRDLTDAFPVRNSVEPLNEFFYGFVMPRGFTRGTLTLAADETQSGGRLVRSVPIAFVEPVAFRAPVAGRWRWGNGPGSWSFTATTVGPSSATATT